MSLYVVKLTRQAEAAHRTFWDLVVPLVKRELEAKYRGSFVGALWTVLFPMLQLGVFAFLFTVVFKTRWNTSIDNPKQYVSAMFVGLIIYTVFAECVNRAPSLIAAHANYVKKVVFPLQILPVVVCGTALVGLAVSVVLLLTFHFLVIGLPPWTLILMPIIVAPLVLFILGVSWIVSSLGVYVRDLAAAVPLITGALMFFSPVFFPIEAVPEGFRDWIALNPLTYWIEEARNVMLWGLLPTWSKWAMHTVGSIAICFLGYMWFQRVRKGFADVL